MLLIFSDFLKLTLVFNEFERFLLDCLYFINESVRKLASNLFLYNTLSSLQCKNHYRWNSVKQNITVSLIGLCNLFLWQDQSLWLVDSQRELFSIDNYFLLTCKNWFASKRFRYDSKNKHLISSASTSSNFISFS